MRGDVAIVLQKPAHVKSRRILAQSLGRGCKTPYERAAADRQRRVQGLGGERAGNREGDAEAIVVVCQCPKRSGHPKRTIDVDGSEIDIFGYRETPRWKGGS